MEAQVQRLLANSFHTPRHDTDTDICNYINKE